MSTRNLLWVRCNFLRRVLFLRAVIVSWKPLTEKEFHGCPDHVFVAPSLLSSLACSPSVSDTPNSFVWEIGHTSPFTHPASQFCTPGQTICDSYDASHWAGFTSLQIKSVTFADGSTAKKWATVSNFGGSAEVNQFCSSYGGPFCIYPWFSSTGTAFNYGVDYPDTRFDYGKTAQFATTTQCSGPLGPTYCDTVINPGI